MGYYKQIRDNIDNYFTNTLRSGVSVTRIPVTKIYDETYGQETLTEGTSESIDCYFTKMKTKWFFDKEGQVEGGDGFILTKSTQTLNKDDIIVYNSRRYRVKDTLNIIVNGVLVGVQGNLFIIE
jgi:hypothetical protein